MSAKEEYDPPSKPIAESLRRSKRISGSHKSSPSNIAKKNDRKSTNKSFTKRRSTPGMNSRRGRSPNTNQSSHSFNGSYLTPEELQQLFFKFKQDGHFRVDRPNISPPPFVISRTTDGKSVTTKIECYDPSISQRTQTDVFRETVDKTSVIFSMPLAEDPTESLISTNKNPGQSIPPKDKAANAKQFVPLQEKNHGHNLWGNYARQTQNALLNPHVYSSAGTGFSDNWADPIIHSKSSAAGNSEANVIRRTSGPSNFSYIDSTPQTLPVQSNTLYETSTSSFWIPATQLTQEARNNSNTNGSQFSADLPAQNSCNQSNEWNATKASAMPNNGVIFPPENANSYASPQSMNSEYQSSCAPWNNDQWWQNSYISATVPPYYNCYNDFGAQTRCETAVKPPIDNQGSVESTINFWSQNNQPMMDFCGTNGNVTTNDSNDFTIAISDIKGPIEEEVFAKGSEDAQNSGFCSTVSSTSYDDDISYANYIGGDMSNNNGNLVQATEKNESSLGLPSIMTIQTEMRPWYDGSHRYSVNNDQSNGAERSGSNSFAPNDDGVDSSVCYTIAELSKS